MAATQNMSEQIRAYIRENRLVRPDAFAPEAAVGLQLALPHVINLVTNSFIELAEGASGRELLWNMAREATEGEPAAQTKSASTAARRGTELVQSVLDDRYHGTVHNLAVASGVQSALVVQLIEIVAAAAFDVMGGLIAERHWDPRKLGDWVRSQPVAAAPVLGNKAAGVAPRNLAAAPVAGGAAAWFARNSRPFLVAVGFLAAGEFGYLMGTHNRDGESEAGRTAQNPAGPRNPGAAQANSGNQYDAMPVVNLSRSASSSPTVGAASSATTPVVLKLKNGLRQIIGANSTESKLYQFLIDPDVEVDAINPTTGWIGFDRIYFESNKATLTNESLWQLSNVASILKRFPAAEVKLGGYTDSSGQPLRNLKLSQERAQAALSSLVSLGVPATRLSAVGYGALDSLTTNATEEGRALNRRVSLRVTRK